MYFSRPFQLYLGFGQYKTGPNGSLSIKDYRSPLCVLCFLWQIDLQSVIINLIIIKPGYLFMIFLWWVKTRNDQTIKISSKNINEKNLNSFIHQHCCVFVTPSLQQWSCIGSIDRSSKHFEPLYALPIRPEPKHYSRQQ